MRKQKIGALNNIFQLITMITRYNIGAKTTKISIKTTK
jgi:hypothetical protein